MSNSRAFLALGLGLMLSVPFLPARAQDDATVVAQVGDHKITADELHRKEGSKLLQAEYKDYVAKRDALNQLIDEQLLQMQAAREGVTVPELLKRHVESQVKDPTEDQMRFYYEGVETDEPFEAVKGKILEGVRQVRLHKARTAYLTSLRSNYDVVVELSPPIAHVDTAGSPRLGPKDAPVQVVEFADYECPYCQKVNLYLQKLHQEFGDKVAIVFKDFPLPMHSHAAKAAVAARCADKQGKFWEYHDALFISKKLLVADLKQQARTLHLAGASFDKCMDTDEPIELIRKDSNEGLQLGIEGTPSFFANGHFMSGAISYAQLHDAVEAELATMGAAPRNAVASTGVKESTPKN
ncbi:MAG: thioredoxin domain-containing protein [Acidobacteriales bacterium]|nr:thioredoxin domain-containing protein [Terriglobales bacterium]